MVDLLHFCSGTSSLSDTTEAGLSACDCCATRECTASQWESSGPLPCVGEEGIPASWCHCISAGICSRRANHFTTLVSFFFFKSIKKMPFSFPLYLSCEFLRRSRGAQHQSVTLSVALDQTSLLHQGSPGICRWHSGCCLS